MLLNMNVFSQITSQLVRRSIHQWQFNTYHSLLLKNYSKLGCHWDKAGIDNVLDNEWTSMCGSRALSRRGRTYRRADVVSNADFPTRDDT